MKNRAGSAIYFLDRVHLGNSIPVSLFLVCWWRFRPNHFKNPFLFQRPVFYESSYWFLKERILPRRVIREDWAFSFKSWEQLTELAAVLWVISIQLSKEANSQHRFKNYFHPVLKLRVITLRFGACLSSQLRISHPGWCLLWVFLILNCIPALKLICDLDK